MLRLVLVLIVLHPVALYVLAPVDCLRAVCAYTYAGHNLRAGLALDNAHLTPALLRATLAQEDPAFYRHHGVDLARVWSTRASGFRGSSTLTQQLVKNVFTGPQKTLWRKYVEAVYALKVERILTKDEILLIYSNIAQTGPDLFGYRAGARAYFGKELPELTDAESMALVGSLPDPVRRTAWIRDGSDMPIEYRDWLARRLALTCSLPMARGKAMAFYVRWGRH